MKISILRSASIAAGCLLLISGCTSAPPAPSPAPPEGSGSSSATSTAIPSPAQGATATPAPSASADVPTKSVRHASAATFSGGTEIGRGFSGTWDPTTCTLSIKVSMVCHTAKVPALAPRAFDRVLEQGALAGGTGIEPKTTKIAGVSGTRVSVLRNLPFEGGFLFELSGEGKHRLQASATTGKTLWRVDLPTEAPLWDLGVTDEGLVLVRDERGITSLTAATGEPAALTAGLDAVILGTGGTDNGLNVGNAKSVGLSRADGGDILTPADVPEARSTCLVSARADCVPAVTTYADDDVIVLRRLEADGAWGSTAYGADGKRLWASKDVGDTMTRYRSVLVTSDGNGSKPGARLVALAWHTGKVLARSTPTASGGSFEVLGVTDRGVVASERSTNVAGAYDLRNAVHDLSVTEAAGSEPLAVPSSSTEDKRQRSALGTFSFRVPDGWKLSNTDGPGGAQTLLSRGEGASIELLEAPDGGDLSQRCDPERQPAPEPNPDDPAAAEDGPVEELSFLPQMHVNAPMRQRVSPHVWFVRSGISATTELSDTDVECFGKGGFGPGPVGNARVMITFAPESIQGDWRAVGRQISAFFNSLRFDPRG